MKREIIAGGLLLFLIAGSLLNIRRVEVLTETVAACALRSERHAARGDFEAALKALDQGLEIWDKAHGYTNVFIRKRTRKPSPGPMPSSCIGLTAWPLWSGSRLAAFFSFIFRSAAWRVLP